VGRPIIMLVLVIMDPGLAGHGGIA
jgi:hypothetical protein